MSASVPPVELPAELASRLRAASDLDLLNAYVNERKRDPAMAAALPKLPAEEVQRQFTGLSNLDAFRQAIAFLRIARDFAQERGKLFGGPEQRVLDFGCGWGRITQLLLPFFPVAGIYGGDVMEEALQHCRRSGLRNEFQRLHPWPPSGFADASFDFVVGYSVFSHLAEDNSFAWIREFSRILKPGGIVAITTRHRDFFLYLKELRTQNERPAFASGAALSFQDTEAALAAYDRGEFCFDGLGGGGPCLTQTYGEAFIPAVYAKKKYAGYFSHIRFSPPN